HGGRDGDAERRADAVRIRQAGPDAPGPRFSPRDSRCLSARIRVGLDDLQRSGHSGAMGAARIRRPDRCDGEHEPSARRHAPARRGYLSIPATQDRLLVEVPHAAGVSRYWADWWMVARSGYALQ